MVSAKTVRCQFVSTGAAASGIILPLESGHTLILYGSLTPVAVALLAATAWLAAVRAAPPDRDESFVYVGSYTDPPSNSKARFTSGRCRYRSSCCCRESNVLPRRNYGQKDPVGRRCLPAPRPARRIGANLRTDHRDRH